MAGGGAGGRAGAQVAAPHRGRLNLLVTLLGKPPGELFAEMEGAQSEFHVGDVKYHTGQAATLDFPREVRPPSPPPKAVSLLLGPAAR